MQKILKTYLNRLINLKGNNRSIFLSKTSKSQDLDLKLLNFNLNEPDFEIIEKLLSGKNNIELCKSIDSRDASSNQNSTILKNIQRKYNFILEERGSHDLFVGWPFVEGKFMDETPVRSPLIFFPVELRLNSKNIWTISPRKDETISFNKNFLLAYSFFNQVHLSETLLEETFEDFGTDALEFKTKLYKILKEENIELKFNSELFAKEIRPFISISKSDFTNTRKIGVLELIPNAILGIFPQHSSYLYPDYQELIEKNKIESLEYFFQSKILKNDKYKKEILIREQYTFNAFPIDAHQEKVLSKIKQGQSLVVQGPPGTGKSQLICNIVTDFLARGKKVLVVCQKKAALDVVYDRLIEKDLEKFIALIHDFKSDRKDLYQKIEFQIDNVENYKIRNSKLDTVFQERSFFELSTTIHQICSEFSEFKNALFNTSECGKSIKELYLTTQKNTAHIDLKQQYHNFNEEKIKVFIKKLNSYLLYAKEFENENYILKDRKSCANYTISDQTRIAERIQEIINVNEKFKLQLKEILSNSFELDEINWVLEREILFEKLLNLLGDEQTYSTFVQYLNKTTDKTRFFNITQKMLSSFTDLGVESSLKKEELGTFNNLLQKNLVKRENPVKWLFWNLFSKEKFPLKRVLVANNLELNKEDIQLLVIKLDARLNLEHNITSLKSVGWVTNIPEIRTQEHIEKWCNQQNNALEAKELYNTLRSFKEFFQFNNLDLIGFRTKTDKLFALLKEIQQTTQGWGNFITPTQIHKITQNYDYAKNIILQLEHDFDALCEFDKVVDSFDSVEFEIIAKLKEIEPQYISEKWISIFHNSIGLSWIEHIEKKYPILRSASTKRFQQLEKELQQAIVEKQEISKEIMLLKTREITYKSIEFNRLKNMTTYRQLANQVVKKRSIWPIRKIVQQFSEELFNLTPCWLCSPETASAIFPLEELFDIVIFDEASQCYSEKAIPSIARGKQIVIVGDSKQLAPNDLYQVRWEELDTNDEPDLEAESILDLASFYLDFESLKQHYRSKSLELIDFSNQHFYNSKLQLIPDFKDINTQPPAIEYHNVNGVWENNTNKTEAFKIVELVFNFIEQKITDIGIVTFNFPQQQLILDLLEAKAIEKDVLIPSSIFVKNIENVQGDERNIIIFSIGYAKDSSNKLRMNFGSLNMRNGENRLNVAITRAKEKIIIISSILPSELNVEHLTNEGPKLFKKYLEYAHNVSKGNYLPTPFATHQITSNYFLKNKLLEENSDYSNELPFADITQKENSKYKSLIFTDDDLYYENISPKETHAYTPLFLNLKKWKFTRKYSRDYWKNKT